MPETVWLQRPSELVGENQKPGLAGVIRGITIMGDVMRPDGRGQPGGVDRTTVWLFDAIKRQLSLASGLPINMITVNTTPALRLSTDSRYQPANQPIDPRWIGEDPIGHGLDAKQGRIC